MESSQLIVETNSAQATRQLGASVASLFDGPVVIALAGDLGAGKTTFVQGLGRALGIHATITSPTFVLINRYRCADGRYLQHADCYRLADAPLEMWDAGLADLLWGEDVVVVEWADRVPSLLPEEHLEITFEYLDDDRRRLTLSPHGETYGRALQKLTLLAASLYEARVEPLVRGH